jgi:hypothetical protein
MVGTDYNMYMTYYQQDIFLIASTGNDDATEIATLLITSILKDMGFGSQMFFLIYETIILVFLYLGCKYYANDYCMAMFIFGFYIIISITGTFWWSMNGIRQAAAISIFFWGSKFWLEKKWGRWIASVVLGYVFHYSILIVVPVLVINNILVNNNILNFKRVLVIIVSVTICTFSGVSSKLLFAILESLPIYGEKYGMYLAKLSDISSPTFGLASILVVIFLLISRYWINTKKNSINKNVYCLAFLFMCIRLVTSFKLDYSGMEIATMIESMFHRVDAYLVLYFIVLLSWWLYQQIIIRKRKMYICIALIIMMIFAAHSIRQLIISEESYALSESPSAGNINYDFRFNLIGE